MIFVHLTDEQRRELEQVTRQAVGRVAMRAHMVLMSDQGYPVPFIAVIHDCGLDVVRHWLHRYEREGVEGLEDEPRSGRPRKDRLGPEIVDAQAQNSPRCSGIVQACWTVGLLAAFLAVRYRLELSVSTVRRYLELKEWHWGRPKLAPASLLRKKRDPEAQAKMAAISAALAEVAKGVGHLLYLDECDLHLLPVIRSMWMKRGQRVLVPTPGKNAKHAFFGALEASSGLFHFADHERKLAVNFKAFLDKLAALYPEGPLYLVLDSAPTHTAKLIEKWVAANPRVTILWLPKYSAHEVNPIERIWGLMKDAVAANRLEGSIEGLVGYARRFFEHDLAPHPIRLPVAA